MTRFINITIAIVVVLTLFTNETLGANSTVPGGNRIVGGTTAGPNELPYQVSLQGSSGNHFCGGSVLSTGAVLTAAHCVDGAFASDIFVVVGEWDLDFTSGREQKYAASELKMHELYNGSELLNDIAIIRLASPLELNVFVQPVRLPEQNSETAQGTSCTVSGWGRTQDGGSPSAQLQKVSVPVVRDEECFADYGGYITSAMICAGLGGKDSCQGDSGGPMNCGGVQVGVVSWGFGCAQPGYPGVYTQVSYYVNWIAQNM